MATSPLCWAGGDISLTSHHQTQPSEPRLRGRLSSESKVQFFINYDNFTPLSLISSFLIQGSAADIAKTALLRSEEKLAEAGVESVLVMMIHDEMVWEVRDTDLHTAASVVKETLETSCETIGMRMETKARIAVGKSWGELSELAN